MTKIPDENSNRWSIKKLLLTGFVCASLAGGVLIFGFYRVTATMMETAAVVSDTDEALSAIKNLDHDLLEAETAERGYVIDGGDDALAAYQEALKKIQLDSDLVGGLTAATSTQKARHQQLVGLIAYRLKTLQMILDARRTGDPETARHLVSLSEDKLEMGKIRAVLGTMEKEEYLLRGQRVRARDAATRSFWRGLVMLATVMVGAAIWQYFQIRRVIDFEKRTQAQIRHMAEHDALTNLANRHCLDSNLELALAYAKRDRKMLAMMMIDLDGFKQVNDQYGHQVGDALLKSVAERLKRAVRANDTAARVGGDEFVLVLSELQDSNDASLFAEKLNHLLAQPYLMGARQIDISASIGIAIFPKHGTSSEALLRCADAAAYQAKAQGKNRYCVANATAQN